MNNFKKIFLVVLLFAGSAAGSAVMDQSSDVTVSMPNSYRPYAVNLPTTNVNVTFTDHWRGETRTFLSTRLNDFKSYPNDLNDMYRGSVGIANGKLKYWTFTIYSEQGSFSKTWKESIQELFSTQKYHVFEPRITISNMVEDNGERTGTIYITLPTNESFYPCYGVERCVFSYNKNTIKVDCGRYSVLIEPTTEEPLTATVGSNAPKDPANPSDRSDNREYVQTTFTTLSR